MCYFADEQYESSATIAFIVALHYLYYFTNKYTTRVHYPFCAYYTFCAESTCCACCGLTFPCLFSLCTFLASCNFEKAWKA